MKKFIMFINSKDFKKGAITCLALLLAISLVGCGSKAKLKKSEFEVLVNKELDLQATTYFDGAKKDEKIAIQKSALDIKTLGSYDLNIKYDKKAYDIKVKVVDKEAPTLKVKKTVYSFDLKTTALIVNETINKDIIITDNYDTKFNDIEIVKDIPKEEKEFVVKLSVEDSSKNKSDEVEIKIMFTKDGKEKKDLKQEQKVATTKGEEKKKEVASTNNGNNTPSKEENKGDSSSVSKPNNNGSSNSKPNNGGSTPPTEKPTTPPRPTPPVDKPSKPPVVPEKPNEPSKPTPPPSKPNPPTEPSKPPVTPNKPKLTVDNFPNYLLGNSGRVFATEDEAYEWANTQVTKEGSPWYEYTMMLVQPFDGSFSNAGESDCPWTVDFWKV